MTDKDFINIAIDISEKAPFPYGAIVVKDGRIIGRSDAIVKEHALKLYTHSEYRAIQNAVENDWGRGDRYGGLYGGMEGCTIYTSCQPCMACMGIILYKQIKKVVYAATLEDSSKYIVKEVGADLATLADLAGYNIEIVKELERKRAVEVLKNWKNRNDS